MKKINIIFSVLLLSTTLFATVRPPQRIDIPDDRLTEYEDCETTRKSAWAPHYCACSCLANQFHSLPLDIALSDSVWYKGSANTLKTGVTAYIYGEVGVHIDLYFNCKTLNVVSNPSQTFVGSVDVEPNNIWDIDEATIAAKLEEAGVTSAVYMCIYPLEEGKEVRLFCNPYNVGPHSTCEDILPVVPGMTFVSSHKDDVYVLRRKDLPSQGTLLVNWFKNEGAACQLTITRGSCTGEILAQVDLGTVYEIGRDMLDLNEDLYFHLKHDINTAGRIRVDVKEPVPTGLDNVVFPTSSARLILDRNGLLYIERDGVRYTLTGSRL